jgi:hypothetical protein
MGGSALYIETQGIKRGLDENGKSRGGGKLKATGNLRDVMKESSQIAFTVARARLADIDPTNDYFDKTDIHLHVPEGATPKDGKCCISVDIFAHESFSHHKILNIHNFYTFFCKPKVHPLELQWCHQCFHLHWEDQYEMI